MIKGIEMVQIPIVEEDPVPLAGEDLAKAQEFLQSQSDNLTPLDEVEFLQRSFGIDIEHTSYPIDTKSQWEALICKNRDELLALCEDLLDNTDTETTDGEDFAMTIIPVGDDIEAEDHFPIKPGATLGYLTIGRRIDDNTLVFSDASVNQNLGHAVFQRWLETRVQ